MVAWLASTVTSIGTPSPPLLLGSRRLWVGPALLPSPPHHSSSAVAGFGLGLRCCHHFLTTPHRQSPASGWACAAAITSSPLLLGSRCLWVGPPLLSSLPHHSSSAVAGFGLGLRCYPTSRGCTCHYFSLVAWLTSMVSSVDTPLHHSSSAVVGLRLRCHHHYTVASLFGMRVHTFTMATLRRALSPLLGSRRLRPALPLILHDRALRRTSPPLLLGSHRPSPTMPPPLQDREPPHLLHGHAPACTSPLLGSCRLRPALLPTQHDHMLRRTSTPHLGGRALRRTLPPFLLGGRGLRHASPHLFFFLLFFF